MKMFLEKENFKRKFPCKYDYFFLILYLLFGKDRVDKLGSKSNNFTISRLRKWNAFSKLNDTVVLWETSGIRYVTDY